MLHQRDDLKVDGLVITKVSSEKILTCSKISASKLMNLMRSFDVHLMFKYGSSEMACSTSS